MAYYPRWMAQRQASAEAGAELEQQLDPYSQEDLALLYPIPGTNRQGQLIIHFRGPELLRQELDRLGFGPEVPSAVIGDVLGGHVEAWLLAADAPNGCFAFEQFTMGHELGHVFAQLVAAMRAARAGGSWQQIKAAGDAHNADPDHQGEGF